MENSLHHQAHAPADGITHHLLSKEHPVVHYIWGQQCDGWTLVQEDQLSVKIEKMPAGTAEALHYHRFAQQFFFILKGTACFDVGEEQVTVVTGQGLHITPGAIHRIFNNTGEDLEFLLCSQPATEKDRINC